MTELGEVHSVFKRGEDFRPVLLRQGKIFEIGDMLSVAVMQETGQEWSTKTLLIYKLVVCEVNAFDFLFSCSWARAVES